MIKWVFDNPVPSTWKEFIEWIEAYDDETDMIETL